MDDARRIEATGRPEPMSVAAVAWGILAMGSGVFLMPRPAAAWGAWDVWLQVGALFGVFVALPYVSAYAVDRYRVLVAREPHRAAWHRLGMALSVAAGVVSAAAYVALVANAA